MGHRIRTHDWSTSELGAPETWPQGLRTAVRLMLNSGHPIYIFWGASSSCLYNDAYSHSIGPERHPVSLGQAGRQVWSEIWDTIGPQIVQVMSGGGPTWHENQLLPITRRGKREEVYWTYSYSPIDDDTAPNGVGGVLVLCTETTAQVLSARRALEDREKFAELFRQAPTFMAMLRGPDHTFEFANPGYMRLIGDRVILGRTVLDALPEAAEQGYVELLDKVYRSGEAYVANGAKFAIQTSAGGSIDDRFVDFVYQPIRDGAGVVVGIFVEGADVTARALADEALRNSEHRLTERENQLATIQEIAKVAGVVVDLRDNFRNERRSPEYRAIHGLAPDADDTHDDWMARVHPDDRQRVITSFSDAMTGAATQYSHEYRIVRPSDGQTRWIAMEARIERDDAGHAVRLIGAHMDVTDRAYAKGLLQESEERFRLIANSAPVPMWVSHLDGKRAFANQAYLDFLGLPFDEALAFDWRTILHPDDLPRIFKEQVAGESSLKPFVLEARYRRADGPWRWMRSESQPRWDPSGAHVGFIGVAHDITASKQAEIELRRLNESLSVQVARRTRERDRIWNVSQDLLLVLDLQGKWLSTNPAWEAALGWTEDELLTANTPDLVDRSFRQVSSDLTQHVLTERSTRYDARFPHRDGTSRWMSWTATMDEDLIYAVGRDITSEKDAQDGRRLAEDALRQSQKLEAMGQLTGGVAHDFNNLLMPIIGGLDMLKRRGLGNEREQRMISGALQSADRAKTLVQRLLAFARRQPLQPVAVDVAVLVSGMAGLIESTTGPQIAVVVDTAEDVWRARVDPNQLEMAILNLSVNARDAMDRGGTIRISATNEVVAEGHRTKLKPASYVRLSVVDTGAGMEGDVLARAIEPFFSTKGVGKGTGLGLSMVHGLAIQSGGALTISSTPNVGTNVELWLPVSDQNIAPGHIAPSPDRVRTTVGVALLVDDEEIVRMSTADMLSELGFAVIEASSAEDALKVIARGTQIDVIISDHLMPGMTGVELAYAVRELRPDTPVLLISGFAEVGGLSPDLPRLTKPFRIGELATGLSAILPGKAVS